MMLKRHEQVPDAGGLTALEALVLLGDMGGASLPTGTAGLGVYLEDVCLVARPDVRTAVLLDLMSSPSPALVDLAVELDGASSHGANVDPQHRTRAAVAILDTTLRRFLNGAISSQDLKVMAHHIINAEWPLDDVNWSFLVVLADSDLTDLDSEQQAQLEAAVLEHLIADHAT